MGDSLDIVNNHLSAMKLDDNFEDKFIQLKEIYEKYKEEIENLKMTIENKDKEIYKLKIINKYYEKLKKQMKAQVDKIDNILTDSKSVTVKNIKSEVEIFQDLADFGPYDAKTTFSTSKVNYENNTKTGEEFDGKRFPYRYQLAFQKDGGSRCIGLRINAGDHDEHLKWPFKGTVRVIVCEKDDKTWKLTKREECEIDRLSSKFKEIYSYLQDTENSVHEIYFSDQNTKKSKQNTKKSEDVVIKCWIFPCCTPQMLQSSS